jgi:hypothetical protein
VQTQLCPLQAQRFASEEIAQTALAHVTRQRHSHQGEPVALTPHIPYGRQGRPTPETPIKASRWHIRASVVPAPAQIPHRQQRQACLVLGPPSPTPP